MGVDWRLPTLLEVVLDVFRRTYQRCQMHCGIHVVLDKLLESFQIVYSKLISAFMVDELQKAINHHSHSFFTNRIWH